MLNQRRMGCSPPGGNKKNLAASGTRCTVLADARIRSACGLWRVVALAEIPISRRHEMDRRERAISERSRFGQATRSPADVQSPRAQAAAIGARTGPLRGGLPHFEAWHTGTSLSRVRSPRAIRGSTHRHAAESLRLLLRTALHRLPHARPVGVPPHRQARLLARAWRAPRERGGRARRREDFR